MTKLSVNINKFAWLRNGRGGDNPNVLKAAMDAQRFGADGITVHPRPDERHIRYKDVRDIKAAIVTEFNIEGNPREEKFMDLVLEVRPEQVTLVPDQQGQVTSDHGWNTMAEAGYLKETVARFHAADIRVSLFVDPIAKWIEGARSVGADRIELYTGPYATAFLKGLRTEAVKPYTEAAALARSIGLGVNAGHDLDLDNLSFFKANVEGLDEVSIGHALVCDALYLGFENTVRIYKRALMDSIGR